ncbi:M56 family metallopeptidase [Calothrix sp. UHCC 0171]|uniref:M56 family metallopeptidase n=1 Tax=Calothrix sp. UHCC 0171 TaxID=3110245 RepID=UPI002B204716|nr:M56 family metallopeptidase [Calothrix sp. UHCC 0171]MEA5570996.1 M56 family metallopeptidase [Calothrix sp. UHCC 0171]
MHLIIIFAAIAFAVGMRGSITKIQGNWNTRWQQTLFLFLFPPLLIFTTAIALLCMGTQGKMGTWHTGWCGYAFACISLLFFSLLLVKLAYQGWKSIQSLRQYPQTQLGIQPARLLNTQAMFAGQIGFWQSELVISQGLLQSLSPEHLETVLAHEQGHYHYRDTFWFFWLGWIRECTAWLPNTQELWQELLILREIRADAYAASRVDNLLLAESLLLVVSNQPISTDILCAALGSSSHGNKLEQRIEALLAQPESSTTEFAALPWHRLLLALLPLVTILFHQ